MTANQGPLVYTRRVWLIIQAMHAGVAWQQAEEAVATTAIEHPEWDMTETRTWVGWEKEESSE